MVFVATASCGKLIKIEVEEVFRGTVVHCNIQARVLYGSSGHGGYLKCSEKSVESIEDTYKRLGDETLFPVKHFSRWIRQRTGLGTQITRL